MNSNSFMEFMPLKKTGIQYNITKVKWYQKNTIVV